LGRVRLLSDLEDLELTLVSIGEVVYAHHDPVAGFDLDPGDLQAGLAPPREVLLRPEVPVEHQVQNIRLRSDRRQPEKEGEPFERVASALRHTADRTPDERQQVHHAQVGDDRPARQRRRIGLDRCDVLGEVEPLAENEQAQEHCGSVEHHAGEHALDGPGRGRAAMRFPR